MGRLKSRRLHESSAFAAAFVRKSAPVPAAPGLRLRSAHFQVLVQPREGELPRHRLGLVVAKRHFAHAVDRNRIKRLIREHFEVERLPLPPGCDVFVRLSGAGFNPHAPELHAELVQLWADILRRAASLTRGSAAAQPADTAQPATGAAP
ncbi:MAG TPA: ribonuclease P protein component [Burkholderiaceae bacterium]|nr:ribonuclease P protein component [Burkholderiaceae bacterium]